MSRGSRNLILLLALVGLPAPVQAAALRQGGELQVNTYVTGYQGNPAVALDGVGNFVVVWRSDGSTGGDTSGSSIQARRYDSAGTPLADQFQVNTYTTLTQYQADVAVDGVGNFVVVWSGQGSGDNYGIFGRRFDAAGIPLGLQFQVHTYATAAQRSPAVAVDWAGNFVVVWHGYGSSGSDTSNRSVQARRYDSAGTPLAPEFQVNTYTTDDQGLPRVAVDGAGNFVVVWESEYGSLGDDTSSFSIQARRYDGAGTPLGAEVQVNTYTTNMQRLPEVAFDGAGNFVVVWESTGSTGGDTSYKSVQARRYDSGGTPLADQFQVNSYTTNGQGSPAVAFDGDGSFVVVWQSYESAGSDTSVSSVQARRYDGAGTPLGAEFQVNTYTTNAQSIPEVAFDGTENFVVAWDSNGSAGSDTSGRSVQAQRFMTARAILGKKLLVKDPSGDETQRAVVALGRETTTNIGPAILGDPVANGATLRVIANGATDSDQTYVLDASGWSVLGSTGFKYLGPTGGDGDAVKKVLIKRTAGGTALVKAIVKGNVGTQSLDVLPPNPASDGGIVLTINGGATYCTAFGGAAGGTTVKDDVKGWKVINASAEACPAP